MFPDDYADKSMKPAQTTSDEPVSDWRALYIAEKQRADTLAGLLKRRHALDPIEVAEALNDFTSNPEGTTR